MDTEQTICHSIADCISRIDVNGEIEDANSAYNNDKRVQDYSTYDKIMVQDRYYKICMVNLLNKVLRIILSIDRKCTQTILIQKLLAEIPRPIIIPYASPEEIYCYVNNTIKNLYAIMCVECKINLPRRL